MDKFGIFNLLNSFFPLNKQKTEQTTDNSTNNSTATTDFLSNLLSSFAKNNRLTESQENKKENKAVSPPHPLQEQMLLTVSNHDALVKRVKQSQKTYWKIDLLFWHEKKQGKNPCFLCFL